MLPLDLHVLSLSLAFILSQDQTLHCTFYFFIRLSLNSSFIVVKNRRWYFITLYLYYIFVVFNLSKNLFPFSSKRTAKLRHFFELTKYFKKNIYFFFSNICSLNSQATSLDCGCKVTTFSETTKIFLKFFVKFFITRYI